MSGWLRALGCFWLLLATAGAAEKTWGVYQILWHPTQFETELQGQIAQLGAAPDHVLFFRDLSPRRGFPKAPAEICRQVGATPVISKELLEWGSRKSLLGEVAAGGFDDYWRKWATDAKVFGDPVILRFGFEMNGDWFVWGQQPELFKQAWRRVYGIVRMEVGAENVQFMFSPNVVWPGAPPAADIPAYYPGDEVVDLLGLDGYNFGDGFDADHRWQTYAEVFEKSLGIMAQWQKPLYLAEMGCAADARKADWLADFFRRLRADDRVAGFIYYNYADGKGGEPDWRLASDPESVEVFRRELRKFAQSASN